MRVCFCVLALLTSLCLSLHPPLSSALASEPTANVTAAAPHILEVIIDLDDTLVRLVRQGDEVPEKTITLKGDHEETYRILDGAPELFEWLSKQPNVRISIFSLGYRERNLQVLSALKLPNGKSASDVVYRLFSREEGTMAHGELYKDLRKVNPNLNEDLIVDDHKDSPLEGERQNVLWIGNKLRNFPSSFSEYIGDKMIDGNKSPGTYTQYRNRLAYVAGVLKRLLKKANDPDFSVQKDLPPLQWTHDSNGNPVFKESVAPDLQLEREGAEEFHQINPQYHYTAALPGKTPIGCIAGQFRRILSPQTQ